MCKLNRFWVAVSLLCAVVLASCTKEEGEVQLSPTITFNNTGGALTANDSVVVGTNITFNVTFAKGTDGKKLNFIRVTRNMGDGVFVPVTINLLSPAPTDAARYNTDGSFLVTTETFTLAYTPHTSQTTGTVTYRFYVEDRDGNKASRDIKVTWTALDVAPTPPISYTLTLDTGSANVFSLRDSALAPARAQDVTGAAQGDYDLYYFISSVSQANFVSTDEADNTLLGAVFTLPGYLAGTATRLRPTTLTANDFFAIDDQSVLQGHFNNALDQSIPGWSDNAPPAPAGSRVNTASNISTGKVVAFNAPGGRFGLIFVSNATQTGMSISVKVMR